MCFTIGLNLLDKGVIGVAAIFGLLPEAHLSYVQVVHGSKVTNTGRYSNLTMIL